MDGNEVVIAIVVVVMAWCAWELWKDDDDR